MLCKIASGLAIESLWAYDSPSSIAPAAGIQVGGSASLVLRYDELAMVVSVLSFPTVNVAYVLSRRGLGWVNVKDIQSP